MLNPKLGDVVWHTTPSLESYAEPFGRVLPRRGKITRIEGDRIVVQSFDEETGAVDHDSHATHIMRASRLFPDEATAIEDYLRHLHDRLETDRSAIATFEARLAKLRGQA